VDQHAADHGAQRRRERVGTVRIAEARMRSLGGGTLGTAWPARRASMPATDACSAAERDQGTAGPGEAAQRRGDGEQDHRGQHHPAGRRTGRRASPRTPGDEQRARLTRKAIEDPWTAVGSLENSRPMVGKRDVHDVESMMS